MTGTNTKLALRCDTSQIYFFYTGQGQVKFISLLLEVSSVCANEN